jgi:hypothetical protein
MSAELKLIRQGLPLGSELNKPCGCFILRQSGEELWPNLSTMSPKVQKTRMDEEVYHQSCLLQSLESHSQCGRQDSKVFKEMSYGAD